MRVTGRRGHMREVPGTCNIGKMGVTFDYPQVRRRRGEPFCAHTCSKWLEARTRRRALLRVKNA